MYWTGKRFARHINQRIQITDKFNQQVLNTVHNAIVMYGCYTGIGTRDSKMDVGTMMEAAKVCRARFS